MHRSPQPTALSFLPSLLLVTAIWLAWSNSWNGPFVLDDLSSIAENRSLQNFTSFNWLFPPATSGETVSGRPFLNFTFAINHAIHGLDVRGYHVGNLLIHTVSALLLVGILRRTLSRILRATAPTINWIATAIAAMWALHPLQTMAVTYLAQRAESLAALFILGTLYCFIRATSSTRPSRWLMISGLSCLLGVLTKETAVIAPILILIYDRAFISTTFRRAWTSHSRYYLSLAATWVVLSALVLLNSGRGNSAGFGSDISAWNYLLTQSEALVIYLGKIVWPTSLVFDHGTPVATNFGEVWWQTIAITSLVITAGWLLRTRPIAGLLAAGFFIMLAPSSSIVPVSTQTIGEHRVYLALAAPVIAIGLLLIRLNLRVGLGLCASVAVLLGFTTFNRNAVLADPIALWTDTVAKRPDNPRAYNNLGAALTIGEDLPAAKSAYRHAIALNPRHAYAHLNLGILLARESNWADAAPHFQAAVAADPQLASAHLSLALALTELGRASEAFPHYERAAELDPTSTDARIGYARSLLQGGQTLPAIRLLQEIAQSYPTNADAHYHLGLALEKSGDLTAAARSIQQALTLRPEWAQAHLALGNIFVAQRNIPAARAALQASIRADDSLPEAHFALGNTFAQQQQFAVAIDHYQRALALQPDHAQAGTNLGNCLLALERVPAAITAYESVLRHHPENRQARANLDIARRILAGR
jgi:tetratricopeptide (TPR) repeat protein